MIDLYSTCVILVVPLVRSDGENSVIVIVEITAVYSIFTEDGHPIFLTRNDPVRNCIHIRPFTAPVKVDPAPEVTAKPGSDNHVSMTIIVDIKCINRYAKLIVSRFRTRKYHIAVCIHIDLVRTVVQVCPALVRIAARETKGSYQYILITISIYILSYGNCTAKSIGSVFTFEDPTTVGIHGVASIVEICPTFPALHTAGRGAYEHVIVTVIIHIRSIYFKTECSCCSCLSVNSQIALQIHVRSTIEHINPALVSVVKAGTQNQKEFIIQRIVANTRFGEALFKATFRAAIKLHKQLDIDQEKEHFQKYAKGWG